MCDEADFGDPPSQTATALTRRAFGLMTTVVAVSACSGTAASHKPVKLAETRPIIPTPDGKADAVFVHPAEGRHPAVVMWPDIAGVRPANQEMARRLAEAGYAVLLVNQYYRNARAPVLQSFAEWRTPEGQQKLQPMIAAIDPPGTTRDAAAFVAWLDQQAAVDTARGIAATGYCMGGPFALRTAAAAPERVKAVGSFHGAALVTDQPDSPHKLFPRTHARYLLAIAANDDARSPGDKDALKAAAAAAGRPAEIEVYAADHGWTVPDSPVYDRAEAEHAWGRLLALLAGL